MAFGARVPRSSREVPSRVRLVCWDAGLEAERRRALAEKGLEVDAAVVESSKLITHIRLTQPDVVVIDLDRLPSHGRTVAVVLRTIKATRSIPLVFLGGAEDKVARVRADIPDAAYGPWVRAASLIRQARACVAPVVPVPHMRQFAGATLEKKLGLTQPLAVIGAPESFLERLGVPVEPRVTAKTKLAIWFIRSGAELEREMEFIALHSPLWIAFPKQTGRFKSDFNQHHVRQLAAAAGLVDNKVCAIDADWSAIRFARRKLQ